MGRFGTGQFGPETIAGFVTRFSPGTRFVVAFSGGGDSLALLHAFARARDRDRGLRLCCAHVDHHLHADSARWSDQCTEVCRRLSVDIAVLDARLPEHREASRIDEGMARAARYDAFERFLLPEDVLCTAHSEDDHVETVLLNLFRGAGPRGIAGIPSERRLGQGSVARPVLGVPRAELMAYARGTGLPLIDDPANAELRYSRVTLRRRIMPVLESRWPGVRATLARAAELGRESAELLDTLAAFDLGPAGGIHGDSLDVEAIGALEPVRRRNALACWLRRQGVASPGRRRIEEIDRAVIGARQDAMPCVSVGNVDVRRFRGRICLVPRGRAAAARGAVWRIPEVLEFEHGRLAWKRCEEDGLDETVVDAGVVVRFRGEDASQLDRARASGRSLKKRFQSLGIPPWERGRIPLVYAGGELAAIGSLWINPRLRAGTGTPGWGVVWVPKADIAAP